MRVLVNATCTLGTLSGVGHYAAELVRAFRGATGPHAVDTFPDGVFLPVKRFWVRQVERYHRRLERGGWAARAEGLARRAALGALRRAGELLVRDPFGYRARRGGYDLYHEPNFHALPCDLPTVVSVHDLSVLLHPEWHPPRRVAEFERAFADTLKRARHLLAISEFGKSEIVRHLGWPADRVSVTHMGVRPGLRPVTGGELARGLAALNLSPGYLLHVGTLEPRKNLEMLVRAYCGLPAAVRERHPLVLAGGRGWKCGELHDFLTREGRAKNVRWLGYVAEEHFAALYSGARALAFPSFYEGFGMPAVEAMACGTAVLASTAGAVAEVAGARACLTDPADEAGWRDAMLRACADGGWLASLREGAEAHAAPFTWRACAEGTLRAYRTALAQPEARKAA